jgi:hypothetical protein
MDGPEELMLKRLTCIQQKVAAIQEKVSYYINAKLECCAFEFFVTLEGEPVTEEGDQISLGYPL